MIDARLLRESPDLIRESLRRRGSTIDLDRLTTLDSAVRAKRQEAEGLRARQKEAGRLIATLDGPEKEAAIAEVAELANAVKEATAEADRLAAE
ncbi:MAG TPA: serine--tRNA ligase, partial [Acidimicrobiia bacterium]